MQKAVDIIDKTTNIVGKIISWIVIILTIIVVIEVVRRRILRAPSYWAFELSTFLFGIHFMLTAPYGMLKEAHVRITILTDKFSPRVSTIIDLLCYIILLIPFALIIFIKGSQYALTSISQLERSWSVWAPPIYPVKIVIPLTGLLILLQAFSSIYKKIQLLNSSSLANLNE